MPDTQIEGLPEGSTVRPLQPEEETASPLQTSGDTSKIEGLPEGATVRPLAPTTHGTGGAYTPKEPGLLETANKAYEGSGVVNALGRLGVALPNMASQAYHAFADKRTPEEEKLDKTPVAGDVALAAKRLLLDPSQQAYEHVEQEARANDAALAAKGKKPGVREGLAEAGGKALATIPMVGPFALQLGERAGKGDVAGALTEGAGYALAPEVLHEAMPGGALPGAAEVGEKAFPTVSAGADLAKRAVGKTASGAITHPEATGAAVLGTAGATHGPVGVATGVIAGTWMGPRVAKLLKSFGVDASSFDAWRNTGLSEPEIRNRVMSEASKAADNALAKTQAEVDNYSAGTNRGVPLPEELKVRLDKAKADADLLKTHAKEASDALKGEGKPALNEDEVKIAQLQARYDKAAEDAKGPADAHKAHESGRQRGIPAPDDVLKAHEKAQTALQLAKDHLDAAKEDYAAKQAAGPAAPDQEITPAAVAAARPVVPPAQPEVSPAHAATTIPQEPQEAPQAFTGMRKLGATGEAGTMGKPLALPEHATETSLAPPEVPQAADVRPLAPPAPATAAEMAGLKAVGGKVVEAPEKAVGPLIKQGLAEGSKAAKAEATPTEAAPVEAPKPVEAKAEAPKYTKEYADTLVDNLRKSVPDAEISTVGSVKRAGESAHDVDLLASEKDIPSITSAMEKQGFKETAGSSVVSPKEAKEAGKEFPTDQWSRVHHFENEEGHKVEVWHKDTSTEAPKTEPGLLSTEKELKNEGRTPEDLTKVDTVVKELPNQDLIRHGSRFGVDESKYDFSKREATREGGSKHPVEREAHANATVNALPEALKNHIVDAANAWDAKDPSVFDQASRSNASRAERARAIMNEAMTRYQDELAAKGQSGGSGAPDKKKLPTGDALIKKYGQSSGDPADTAFILKDGRGVANTGVDHDVMLGGKATDAQPPREQYVQEGTIRVRPRQGTIGGREVSLSIPPSGVTPEQLEYIKKMSPQLRSGAVLIENGERGGDYRVIEYGKATNEALENAINDLGPKGARLDKQIVEAHNEGGGSSIYPEKGKLQDGYSVGINKELEQTVDKDKITAEDVKAYRDRPEVQKALKDNPDAYIGTWVQDGKTYFDTSVHAPDLEAAKKLGADNKQLAIFDLKNKETIDLAKAYKDMTPAEQDALAAKGQSGGSGKEEVKANEEGVGGIERWQGKNPLDKATVKPTQERVNLPADTGKPEEFKEENKSWEDQVRDARKAVNKEKAEALSFDPNRFRTQTGEDTELRPLGKKKNPLGKAKK